MVKVLCAINTKAENLWIYTDCEQSDKKVYINLDSPFRLLEPVWPIFKDPGKTYLAVAEVSVAVDKYCLTLSVVIIFPFQNNMDSTQSLFFVVLSCTWHSLKSNWKLKFKRWIFHFPYKNALYTCLHVTEPPLLQPAEFTVLFISRRTESSLVQIIISLIVELWIYNLGN